jgi:amino acid adenylation domain-containing protein/thioester reductase-like protein
MDGNATFLDRLAAITARYPDAPAVLTGGTEAVSYRELLDRADRLAAGLPGGGIVGLGLGRSAEFVIAVLACWKAGAAFLPLDARWPADRLAFVGRDSGMSIRILDSGFWIQEEDRSRVPNSLNPDFCPPPPESLPARQQPDDVAYVIYTSGSTGRPKGVVVGHRGIVNLCDAQIPAFDLTPGSRVLWVLSPAFDASVSDVGTALLSGSTLCVEPEDELRDPLRLTRLLHDRGITHVDLPPALLRVLDPTAMPATLRTIVIGGEPSPPEVVRRWAGRFRVVNVYGPTEATVCTSLCTCDPETWTEPLIGRPIPNTTYHVLDDGMNPVAPDEVGELFIGGIGLTLGYLNRPELTAEKFLTHHGERLYRTGDRVRLRADGEHVFVGRADRQFKVRGQLVEPGEVEARLCEHLAVREAAVVKRLVNGREVVVAAVVNDTPVSAPELRGHLSRSLAPWMVPQRFEFVAALPRTTSGKIDYPRLAEPAGVSPVPRLDELRDGEEEVLADTWSRVLGGPADLSAGFFEQGGDSLGVFQVVTAAHARGLTVPPAMIANGWSILELAVQLRNGGAVLNKLSTLYLEWEARHLVSTVPPAEYDLEAGPPHTILLTGATGFLGSWLLRELLSRTPTEVTCLVRDPARLPPDPRVRLVRGDLERPRLGLSDPDWNDLTAHVDTVFHCGAAVNVVLPYSRLRQTNLVGTAEVLRFLATGRPKRLHHASTLSVFVSTDRNRGVCLEDNDLSATQWVYGGYAQSKWAAERFLRLAGGRCGPVVHHRLGLITGDTESGRMPGRDHLSLFLRGLARIGGYPAGVEAELFIDITPVDYAAAAMAHLALTAHHPDGTTFHVANPCPLPLARLLDAMRAAGVRLDQLPEPEFRRRAADLDGAAACLGLCRTTDSFDRLRTADLFQATAVTFDQRNTTAGLAGSGITCPPPSPGLLAKYVAAALHGADRR